MFDFVARLQAKAVKLKLNLQEKLLNLSVKKNFRTRTDVRPRAYIAGPMRGYTNYNFDAFDKAAAKLRGYGYAVISPADLDRVYLDLGVDAYIPDDTELTITEQSALLGRDVDVILSFRAENGDIIYMLDKWLFSKGACVERAVAAFMGIECYRNGVKEPPTV